MERPVRSSWLEWLDKSNIKLGAFPQHQKCPFGARGFIKTHRAHLSIVVQERNMNIFIFRLFLFMAHSHLSHAPELPFI